MAYTSGMFSISPLLATYPGYGFIVDGNSESRDIQFFPGASFFWSVSFWVALELELTSVDYVEGARVGPGESPCFAEDMFQQDVQIWNLGLSRIQTGLSHSSFSFSFSMVLLRGDAWQLFHSAMLS